MNIIKSKRYRWCLALAVACGIGTAVQADEVGHYQGSPYATWQGLYEQGIQVRTLRQPAANGETLVRRYLMYIPSVVYQRQQKYPLVIVTHGGFTSPELLRHYEVGDRLERLADEEEFILVYANGYSFDGTPASPVSDEPFNANAGYWRTCGGPPGFVPDFYKVDDTDYLKRVIAQLQQEALPLDSEQIFVWGMANGGEMALQAARNMGGELAGVGAIVSPPNMPANIALNTCETGDQDPTSMMIMYAPEDPVIDPIFSSFGLNYSVLMEQSVDAWLGALGIDENTRTDTTLPDINNEGMGYEGTHKPAASTMNSQVIRSDYTPASNGASLSVLTFTPNAGHAWPSFVINDIDAIEEHGDGFRNNDIEAERVLWEYFKDKKRIK